MTARSPFNEPPDKHFLKQTAKKPNLLVPAFLMLSYLYYEKDVSLVTDATFEVLTKRLGDQWASIEHRHKALIDPSLLKTGFYLKYPLLVRSSAIFLAACWGIEVPED